MKKFGLLQRICLKLLAWSLGDTEHSCTHQLNKLIYLRSTDGRQMAPPFSHPQVFVGEYSYGFRRESFFFFHPNDRVVIGKFCSIADGVKFILGNHSTNTVSTFPFHALCFGGEPYADSKSKGNIEIGNDVWIGANALILSGVKIGHGAVIAAGAVVNKDVAPYAVVGGVPAKVIKMRFDSDQVAALEKIQWWNWPIEKIKENLNLLYDVPEAFIRLHLPQGE